MKTPSIPNALIDEKNNPAPLKPASASLVGVIRSYRTSVGDALSDSELTHLLCAEGLQVESGFTFLCLSDGCVTFQVPPQSPARWYREGGWLSTAKEEVARAIASKHGLQMYEPPDETAHARHALGDTRDVHHHLVFGNAVEDIIIVHPRFLKVRFFCTDTATRHLSDAKLNELVCAELLGDLARLYRD